MKGPSNKVAVFFVVLTLIVAGTIALSVKNKQPSSENAEKAAFLTTEQTTEVNTIDADNDGLLDWEEELRLSDPTNPDTDGDGDLDGAEVSQGRDPIVAGPDDDFAKTSAARLAALEPIYEDYEEGTLTAQLASNFLLNYAEHGGSESYSTTLEPQLAAQLAADVDALTDISSDYDTQDILTFAYDAEKVHNYGNEFAVIQKELLERLVSTNTSNPSTYLEGLADVYADIAYKLTNIAVPYPLLTVHLAAANNIARVGRAIHEINANERTDPVRSLFAIKDYNAAADAQLEIYTTIATYFKDNDIIFESDEPGNFWNNI